MHFLYRTDAHRQRRSNPRSCESGICCNQFTIGTKVESIPIIYFKGQVTFGGFRRQPVPGLHHLGNISLGQDMASVGLGRGFGKDICMIMDGRHLDTSDIHCRSESGYMRYCLYTNKNLPGAVQSDENVGDYGGYPRVPSLVFASSPPSESLKPKQTFYSPPTCGSHVPTPGIALTNPPSNG